MRVIVSLSDHPLDPLFVQALAKCTDPQMEFWYCPTIDPDSEEFAVSSDVAVYDLLRNAVLVPDVIRFPVEDIGRSSDPRRGFRSIHINFLVTPQMPPE